MLRPDIDDGVNLIDPGIQHLALHQIACENAGDTEAEQVTPTRMPSLGVIVRLFSFTGTSPGMCAHGRANGGMNRLTIW